MTITRGGQYYSGHWDRPKNGSSSGAHMCPRSDVSGVLGSWAAVRRKCVIRISVFGGQQLMIVMGLECGPFSLARAALTGFTSLSLDWWAGYQAGVDFPCSRRVFQEAGGVPSQIFLPLELGSHATVGRRCFCLGRATGRQRATPRCEHDGARREAAGIAWANGDLIFMMPCGLAHFGRATVHWPSEGSPARGRCACRVGQRRWAAAWAWTG